mmetsp:Transcript_126930/g.353474  ORF Transcript_126930/g.353474 Transcript_126930/m.353474 type:complete len:341 (+) Transcript_126930:2-1024(+)
MPWRLAAGGCGPCCAPRAGLRAAPGALPVYRQPSPSAVPLRLFAAGGATVCGMLHVRSGRLPRCRVLLRHALGGQRAAAAGGGRLARRCSSWQGTLAQPLAPAESAALGERHVPALLEALRDQGWREALASEFAKPYFSQLARFVAEERAAGMVYPPADKVFEAFNLTPPESLKAVIIGQDPYHGPGQAHGLCFSVPRGIPVPRSLRNVYAELEADIPGFRAPGHGHLTCWAQQGILMLNATLTVRRSEANSHAKCGWQMFTDAVIRTISEREEGVVFLLWGRFAQQKGALVDRSKHHVLEAVHPSPISASRGWFGCRVFSGCNAALRAMGRPEVDWRLG